MGLKECDKCKEMVDEAKAFCPGCGHAFVKEEKRQKASEFEKLDNTVQLGNTMYNQMLSDMGLNISKVPSEGEKRIEIIAPVDTRPAPPKVPKAVAPPEAKLKPAKTVSAEPKSASKAKWIVLWVLGVIFLFPIALASSVSVIFEIWSRLK